MNLLITCFIIVLNKFGMQSVFNVDFMSIFFFFANILTCSSKMYKCYFSVSLHRTCGAQWNFFFFVLDRLHRCSYTSRQKHQLLVHSKVLCLTVSNPRKMWHGHSLMGSHWHIQDWTQNLPLRSACRSYCSGPPKHHHCLPETLLPKILVSKYSVSLIWIYIYSQFQTNMWDAFLGCDSVTQNCVAFTWISSLSNVNKWGCIASQDINSAILLLYCECVMQGSNKKKMIEIKGHG